jgi:hypothetical protein
VQGIAAPQQHPQPSQQQPGFSLGRDVAVMHAPVELSDKQAVNLSLPANGSAAAHETFAAMDLGTESVAPTWFHAGAHQAEAGFRDPGLGWIGVRAQTDARGMHAAVVPNSAEASQALSGHLAGLNAYLADGHAGVAAVTLTAPESRLGEQAAGTVDQTLNQSYEGTGGQATGQQGNSGSTETPHASSGSSEYVSAHPTQETVQQEMSPPGNGGSSYISVMA